MAEQSEARISLLTHTFTDKNVLYKAYMPFVANGGLFLITTRKRTYKMGERLSLVIKLNFGLENDTLRVKGHVVWLTPSNAEGYRAEGIGIQFDKDDAGITRNKIEDYLAGGLNSANPTHTM